MNYYGGAIQKRKMTRDQALGKAHAKLLENANNAGLNLGNKYPTKGSPEAKILMDYVRGFKTNPPQITAHQAVVGEERFYSPHGRYNKYHPGHSWVRAKAQDEARSMGEKRIISDRRYIKRPDLWDFRNVDTGDVLPRFSGPGGIKNKAGQRIGPTSARFSGPKGSEQAKALMAYARAARSKLTTDRRRLPKTA